MADEAVQSVSKSQEIARRVQELIALADTARSSGNALDLAAVQQTLGSEAMLDAAVAMMQGFVQGDLDNQAVQAALTSALAQQKLIEDSKAQGTITEDQATKMTATIVEELKAATPVKAAEVAATPEQPAPAAEAPHINQVEAKRAELEASAGKPLADQVAEARARQAGAIGLGAA